MYEIGDSHLARLGTAGETIFAQIEKREICKDTKQETKLMWAVSATGGTW